MHRLFGNQKWLSAFEFLKQKNTELDIWLSSKSLKGFVSVSITFLGQIREMTSLFRCPWFSALKLSLLFSFKLPSSMTRCDPHTNTNTKQIQVTIFHYPVRSKATILTPSPHCIYNTRLIHMFFMPKFNNAHQAHWTDLLGAMCILLAVTGMGFESKVIQNI